MTRRGVYSVNLSPIESCGQFEADSETLLLLQSNATLENGQTVARDGVLLLTSGERVAFSAAPAIL